MYNSGPASPYIVERQRGVLVATHNADKFETLSKSLLARGVRVLSPMDFGFAAPDETEATFLGNAALKAVSAAKLSGEIAMADDGGFSIAALGGRPGVASRDWASDDGNYTAAIERIGFELDTVGIHCGPAWVTTALVIAWPDGKTLALEDATDGQLVWPPRGIGFDFDPIFAIFGDSRTLAERDTQTEGGPAPSRLAYAHRVAV
ncbi:MAG: non-canonical purine NTP pyrophosphatase, partial [Bosea sp. (in: a-proteobacteria)]